jgi:hypothetical protein
MVAMTTDAMTFPLLWGACEPLEEERLDKALGAGELDPAWLMKGLATSEFRDADDQVVDQDGIDWTEYDQRGIVHYKHPYSADRVCAQGVKREPVLFKGYKGNFIETLLLKDIPLARQVREQHLALCKGPRGTGLGFSVEGSITEMRGNRITKCKVRTMAIDAAPRNPSSFALPLAAAFGAQMGLPANLPPDLMKAAMRLAYDPEIQLRLALTEGIPAVHLKALRLLRQQPDRTLRAALERIAAM